MSTSFVCFGFFFYFVLGGDRRGVCPFLVGLLFVNRRLSHNCAQPVVYLHTVLFNILLAYVAQHMHLNRYNKICYMYIFLAFLCNQNIHIYITIVKHKSWLI